MPMSAQLAALPVLPSAELPALSREQMREVDRIMIEEYGVQLIQMMENAGLQLADLVRRYLGGALTDRRVVVLAGQGNNGGGGLAAARRLAAWGAEVEAILAGEAAEYRDVPELQLGILERMGVAAGRFRGSLPRHDILIDAVIGYSLLGAPRGVPRKMIAAANDSASPVISLDAPSGVDVDSGAAPGDAVRAAATLTLALPKAGLLQPDALPYVGDLYLADISVPAALYSELGFSVPAMFDEGPLVRVPYH